MKAILEFDLSDVDDNHKFELCNKAEKMNLTLIDIEKFIRDCNKHGCPPNIKTLEDYVLCISTAFYNILEENDVRLHY